MMKFQKINAFVKFEKVLDFSREVDIISLQRFYMKVNEVLSYRNIPLYAVGLEDVTTIYNLTCSTSDWVRENLKFDIEDKLIILPDKFMYKFDLIRVIPEGGLQPYESFLRVKLKQVPENVKLYSLEEEMYGENWKQEI